MRGHLNALVVTVFLYFGLAVSYLGWGRIFARMLGIPSGEPRPVAESIWLGWAVSLVILQTVHLAVALRGVVALVVLGIGLIAAFPHLHQRLRQAHVARTDRVEILITAVLFAAIAVWVASKAMLPPTNYDSGLYHFNAVRWMNTYPIVIGLGNLHERLAFNQSFLTYVAAVNLSPWFDHGRSVANSFLLLLSVATVWPALRSIRRTTPSVALAPRLWNTLNVLALPVLVHMAFTTDGLSSPSADLASALLQVVLLVTITRGFLEHAEGRTWQDHRIAVISVLAATAITIKLSNIAICGTLLIFLAVYVWSQADKPKTSILRYGWPIVFILGIWMIRGVMTSGMPIFPSTFLHLPFEWAVPRDKAIDTANWVYSWARAPGRDWQEVLGNNDWLAAWYARTKTEVGAVVYPLAYSVLIIAIAVLMLVVAPKRARFPALAPFALVVPWIVGLLFWFFTAPDLRFAGSIFWVLGMSSSVLLLLSLRPALPGGALPTVTAVVVLLFSLPFLMFALNGRYAVRPLSTSGWYAAPKVELQPRITNSGLTVYVPAIGDQTWDAPLPATPYFNPALRLRKPDDPAAGFTVAH